MSEEKTIIADSVNLTILRTPMRKKACLVQYNGTKLGRRYPLSDDVTVVGRSADVQVCISEASVSRQHARFITVGTATEIEDLGSSNGTFVNDMRTTSRVTLRDGDMIRLGTILLKYFAHDNVESMMADKIYRMATIDAGTQIFNKQYLLDTLESEFKFCHTYGRPLSVIYYDLDFFKKVNDTYGHNAGDFILKESANLVKSFTRKDDVLGRFGGEEFVVVLPNTEQKTAAELAERIRIQIATHSFKLDIEQNGVRQAIVHTQTISIGVAQVDAQTQTFEQLLEAADKKLYFSKQNGRNRVTT